MYTFLSVYMKDKIIFSFFIKAYIIIALCNKKGIKKERKEKRKKKEREKALQIHVGYLNPNKMYLHFIVFSQFLILFCIITLAQYYKKYKYKLKHHFFGNIWSMLVLFFPLIFLPVKTASLQLIIIKYVIIINIKQKPYNVDVAKNYIDF